MRLLYRHIKMDMTGWL